MPLPARLPGTRLLAFGVSVGLHIAGIAALAGFLEHRSDTHRDPPGTLTVFSLAAPRPLPTPPHAAPAAPQGRPGNREPAMLPGAANPVSPAPPPATEPVPVPMPPPPTAASLPSANETDTAYRDYQAALWRRIETHRPRGIAMEGTVSILFRISPEGALLSASVSQSSGNILLDKIALRAVRQAAPFPQVPLAIPASRLTFEIPVHFR